MFDFDEKLVTTLFFYLVSCYGLYTIKHPKMFDENGNFKCFGLHQDETIYPFWLVTTLIGISSYYLLLLKDRLY